ncbi:E3 SUMO-protein ligase PIAS1-like isoform X1 [Haemaphysalis longicornis]
MEKVPEEELLRSLYDGDDVPYVHKRADTRHLVRSHFVGSGGDAVVEALQVSLVCPLSRRRMKVPCRGVHCRHVQCFDAYTYLTCNKNTLKRCWFCPVCELELPVEDMRVDLFTLDFLDKAEEHCDDVTLFADGHWENVAAGKDDQDSIILIEDSITVIEDSPVKTPL